jgi:hypothetical protein
VSPRAGNADALEDSLRPPDLECRKLLGIERKVRFLSSEEHDYAPLRRELAFQVLEPITRRKDMANPFCGS